MAFSDTDSGELAGIGGWLAFLVISLGILSPIGTVVLTAANLYGDPMVALGAGDQWGVVQVMEWSISLLAAGGAIFLAWLLQNRHVWRTIRIVIPGLWIVTVGLLLVEFAGVSLLLGIPFSDLLALTDLTFIRPFVYATIWTLYLLNSRRVANTYDKSALPDGVAEVFE